MSETNETIRILHQELLDAYQREYDRLNAAFRDLDGKSQSTITVAGIFLAAAFAFINQSHSHGDMASRIMLTVLILALVATVLLAILVLKLKELHIEPPAREVRRLVEDLQRVDPDKLSEHLPYFYGDQSQLWLQCIDSYRTANAEKGGRLQWAQWFLLASVALAAALAVRMIIIQ